MQHVGALRFFEVNKFYRYGTWSTATATAPAIAVNGQGCVDPHFRTRKIHEQNHTLFVQEWIMPE